MKYPLGSTNIAIAGISPIFNRIHTSSIRGQVSSQLCWFTNVCSFCASNHDSSPTALQNKATKVLKQWFYSVPVKNLKHVLYEDFQNFRSKCLVTFMPVKQQVIVFFKKLLVRLSRLLGSCSTQNRVHPQLCFELWYWFLFGINVFFTFKQRNKLTWHATNVICHNHLKP